MRTGPSSFLTLSLALVFGAMLALPANAGVVTNEVVPFTTTVTIDCDQDGTPEDIVPLSGQLHVLITTTSNATVTTIRDLFVPRNVTGTGTITGATYRGVGNTQDTTIQVTGGPNVFTFVNNFYIVGQDEGYRYLIHETFHVTIDANGNVVVSQDNAFVTCPGS
jgi:hypothetical protein